MTPKAAIYARVSTDNQDTASQIDVCINHAKSHPDIESWDIYSDVQSGHDDTRTQYITMKEAIEDGVYDYFICSEFSRISRNDGEIKAFVSDCFNREMGFEVVQASFSASPDADDINRQALKIVADTLANIATMENLQKIDRIKRGMHHARENGKWTRKPPAGFEVHPETKYLQVNVPEFLAIREALLEHYYKGSSWSKLAKRTPVQRTTLSRIYNDDNRRRLYIHGDGWDRWNRDDEALKRAELCDEISPPEVDSLKDANLKLYLQILNDAPERIDPEAERKRRKRATPSAETEAMLKTFRDMWVQKEKPESTPTNGELLDLFTQHLNADTDSKQ